MPPWFGSPSERGTRMHRCGRAAADGCPLGGRTLPDMQPLIGITGEQKPASTLIDVLDVLRTVDIDIFYGDYARAVQRAGGIPVWIPADAGPEILERLDGLLLSGGDDIDPAEFGQEPDPNLGNSWINLG